MKGNLSIRDLKLIGSDASMFWRLHQSVRNFLLKLKAEYESKHGRPRSVVYVLPKATLREVIDVLADHEIHRVYIVNSHRYKKPVGVISLRDILFEVLE